VRARTDYEGGATVEADTIAYDRDGSTEAVITSAHTPAGERMLMRSGDPEPMLAASSSDLVGEPVRFAGGERVYVPSARAVSN